MLPYLADRPLDVRRYSGAGPITDRRANTIPRQAPEWLRRWTNDDATVGTAREHVVADSAAALAWLANWGAVELRPWASTLDDPQRPTWALLDIEPDRDADLATVLEIARLYRAALAHLSLEGRPVVTGTRGIQVWVPIAPRYSSDHVAHWVATISAAVRVASGGVDDGTGGGGAVVAVAPFCVRGAPGAPVAVPVTWDELDDDDLRPDRWTTRRAAERLRSAGDPLAPLIGRPQRLPSL